MADLIYPPDYPAQLAQAAAIMPEAYEVQQRGFSAQQAGYAEQQEAQQTALENLIKRMEIPAYRAGIAQALGSLTGQGEQPRPNIPNRVGPVQIGNQPEPPPVPQATAYPLNQAPSSSPLTLTQGSNETTDEGTSNQHPTSTEDAPETATGPGTTNGQMSSDHIDGFINMFNEKAADNLQPVPTDMDPETAQKWQSFESLKGLDPFFGTLADGVKGQWEAQVNRENEQRKVNANLEFSIGQDLALAAPGTRKRMLEHLAPNIAQMLGPDITDEQLGDLGRHVASTTFRYTGRPVEIGKDGYMYDSSTGMRIPGNDTRVGLSKDQQAEIFEKAITPSVEITEGDKQYPVAPWVAANKAAIAQGQRAPFSSAQDWAMKVMENNGIDPISGASVLTVPNTPITKQSAGETSTKGTSTSESEGYNGVYTLGAPLNYSTGAEKAPQVNEGFGAPINQQAYNKYVDAAQDYLEFANAQNSRSTHALAVDRDMLRNQLKPGINTGPGELKLADLKTVFQNVFFPNGKYSEPNDPALIQILNKRLSTDAFSNVEAMGKEAGGVRASAMMANIAIRQMSANPNLARGAIEYMLRWDIANNLYNKQKYGQDFNNYRNQGNRADDAYESWYNTYGRPEDQSIPTIMRLIDNQGTYHHELIDKARDMVKNGKATPDQFKEAYGYRYTP